MNRIASEVERAGKDLMQIAQDLREGRVSHLEAIQRIARASMGVNSAIVEAAVCGEQQAGKCPSFRACQVSKTPMALLSIKHERLVAAAGGM